jgi:dihydroorotate dehydrogenase electron transfer subunit
MISQFSSLVLSKEKLLEKIYKLNLSSPLISKEAKPGNFVHVKVSSGDSPLLRRAFSIHSVDENENSYQLLFRVIGRGTEILSRASPGDELDVLGPIGNSFSLPGEGQEIMLVAGGMGIAPLWFLFDHLAKRFHKDKLTVLVGAKTKEELLGSDKLQTTGAKLIVATDDGSAGRKGLVTEVFLKEMKKRNNNPKKLAVYSCGPQTMLRRMSEIAEGLDLSCQMSLETHMACGVGACWGCAYKVRSWNYKRVCVDGPVFNARQVDWG